jgi:hypothetical protein
MATEDKKDKPEDTEQVERKEPIRHQSQPRGKQFGGRGVEKRGGSK